jgi:hypothetical protein
LPFPEVLIQISASSKPENHNQPQRQTVARCQWGAIAPNKVSANTASVANLTVMPGVGGINVETVFFNGQSKVQDAKLIHVPSSRKYATT